MCNCVSSTSSSSSSNCYYIEYGRGTGGGGIEVGRVLGFGWKVKIVTLSLEGLSP
ncbi:hypothetical protein WAI453_004269 [Rhynchosporium graminicola]